MNLIPFLIFISIFLAACGEQKTPRTTEKQQPQASTLKETYPAFDGNSAFNFLTEQTNFGPRNPNSIGHQKCLMYLNDEVKKYADSVVLQPFSHSGYGELLRLTNVFASFKPDAKKRILLVAHWDTRPRAEEDPNPANRAKPIIGANDGASGVAVLLELAKMFKSSPPPIGVDILLTDGEDYGDSRKDKNDDLYFLGAKYFAKTKSTEYTPEFGILLDMIGDRDLQIPMEQFSMDYAPHVMDLIWTTADDIGIPQFVRIPGERVSDDHLALNEAGIPTVDLIDFDFPSWHTLADTPDKCSPESLEAVGKVLTVLIYTKLN